jgi:hypothetical protein
MEEEHIRKPDEQIRDCLFQNYPEDSSYTTANMMMYDSINGNERETEEDQLRRIMEESESEFEYHFAILESKRLEKEREERATHFAAFKTKIVQFMRIDVANRPFYSELIGYIDRYELGEIQTVKVENDFYMKVFYTINNMRIRQEDKSRLFAFIQLA